MCHFLRHLYEFKVFFNKREERIDTGLLEGSYISILVFIKYAKLVRLRVAVCSDDLTYSLGVTRWFRLQSNFKACDAFTLIREFNGPESHDFFKNLLVFRDNLVLNFI